jgi:hypothetical protein
VDDSAATPETAVAVFQDWDADSGKGVLVRNYAKCKLQEQLAALEVEKARILRAIAEEDLAITALDRERESFHRAAALVASADVWAWRIGEARRPLTVKEYTTLLNAKWGA